VIGKKLENTSKKFQEKELKHQFFNNKMKNVWKFTNQRELTRKEFLRYFEKKVLRTVRQQGGLSKDYSILGNDLRSEIIKRILRPIQVSKKNKIILNNKNLDDFSIEILEQLMSSKFGIEKSKNIQPLYFLTDKEILLYAKIKNIDGKIQRKLTKKQVSINHLIESFEKTNQDTRLAIISSLEKI